MSSAPPARRIKFVFVNRYFDPDQSATSQMLTDLARGLVARACDVHVVCSRQLYTDAGARLPPRQDMSGVAVHRVATTRFGRAGLIGRAVDYASFYISSVGALLMLLKAGDVLIAKTDPPLFSVPAAVVARLKRVQLVNWQQDVFPETASQLAANPLPRWLDPWVRRVRDWSMRRAKMNVLIGHRMFEYFRGRGVPSSRLCVIENWSDTAAIRPKAAASSALRARLGLDERFVVGYSGNLGRAHEFQTLLAAAEALRSDPSIVFLMIGGGANMEPLRRAVLARSLNNFLFLPYQPRDALEDSLAAADVHLVSLLPALEGLIMPSKLYGILAAGRPIVFVGDADGEIARIVGGARCGVTVAVNAGGDLAEQIRRLQSEPGTRSGMGTRAREIAATRYGVDKAVERWIQVLGAAQP